LPRPDREVGFFRTGVDFIFLYNYKILPQRWRCFGAVIADPETGNQCLAQELIAVFFIAVSGNPCPILNRTWF